ncbi:hypothetical protein, conserved [Leishmania tarentolae]|uniref:Uncharacterized protein n=1 Tax=Leishmania tarentolae TaxID=5689 RepID=A0A640KD29_LEITA|nr:hypothetical protein, conserved [Leishmania tarentolae]
MHNATADPQSSSQALLLPTYALVLTISADAVAHNATANTSTLFAAPDLLYRGVQLLRDNVSGPALFNTLARGRDGIATASLNSLTVNFTLRNGVDLHTANATMSALLPSSSGSRGGVATPVPEHPAHHADPGRGTGWHAEHRHLEDQVVGHPEMPLLSAAAMVYGTYYVYKRHLRPAKEPREAVVVENTQ